MPLNWRTSEDCNWIIAEPYPYYEQAVALAPDESLYLNDLGILLNTLGEYDKAIDFYTKALNIFETRLGKDHPNTKTVRENIETLNKK